jgi:predicted Zn-dependent protease
MLLQGALIATAIGAAGSDYSNLAIGAASVGAQLINQRYGRSAELESDRYGMQYMARAGYDPAAAIALQETFVRLSEGRDEGWLAGLFASHPPSAERVAQNRATAATLPASGELGQDRHQAAIRRLIDTKPAYDAYDRGRAAFAEERFEEAERLAAEAVRLEPNEAHFHALQGDIDSRERRFDDAVRHYDDAIARNDQYFYYHLRKGVVEQRLGRIDAAAASYEASATLLPTADALYGLGSIAEQRGDRTRALELYSQAAGSASAAGQAAQDAVVRLDLPQSPGKYLSVRTGLDEQQRLIVEVGNPTRLPVADIVLLIRYADAAGAIRELAQRLNTPLEPGSAQRYNTGLGPFPSADAYQVTIRSARPVTG